MLLYGIILLMLGSAIGGYTISLIRRDYERKIDNERLQNCNKVIANITLRETP